MKNQWIIGVAAAAGLILGKTLIPALGDYLEKRSLNPVTPAQVQQYISNSKMINFKAADFAYGKSYHDGNMFFRGSLFQEYRIRTNYAFYDPAYKKYFAIEMFDYPNVSAFDDLLKIAKNVPIAFAVNASELADPAYGSQNNPVPSFKILIPADTAWKPSYQGRAKIVGHNNAHYVTSVRYHLTYFKSRQEFQKMFPEQH